MVDRELRLAHRADFGIWRQDRQTFTASFRNSRYISPTQGHALLLLTCTLALDFPYPVTTCRAICLRP